MRAYDLTVTGSLVVSGSSLFTVNDAGKVGIGNTNPPESLTVNGGISGSGTLTIIDQGSSLAATIRASDTTNGYGLAVESGGTASTRYNVIFRSPAGLVYGGIATATGQVGFWAIGTTPTGTLGSRLNVNGNVAIGANYLTTAAPTNGMIVEGNIGIGTTSPQSKLDIVEVYSAGTSVQENLQLLIRGGESDLDPVGSSIGMGFGYGSANDYVKTGIINEFVDANGRAKLHLATSNVSGTDTINKGDARLTILQTGEVGIGTVSPAVELHLSGSGTTQFRIEGTGASDARIEYYSAGVAKGFGGYNTSTDTMALLYNTSMDSTTGINIDSSGNVGIGTASPGALLHVAGGHILIDNAQEYRIKNNAGTIKTVMRATSGDILQLGWSGGDTTIQGSSYAERVRFKADGKVGIGTVAPTVALEISGSGNISSRARFLKAGKVLQLGADRDTTSVPYIGAESNHAFDIITNNTQRVRIDTSGNLTFNSGIALEFGDSNTKILGSSVGNYLSFTPNGTELLKLVGTSISGSAISTGSFGSGYFDKTLYVGTTTHSNRVLKVHGTSGDISAEISNDATSNAFLRFSTDLDGTHRSGIIGIDYSDNVLRINHGGSFDGVNNGMAINSSGDIGIGIAPNANFKTYVYDNTNSADAWALNVYQDGAGGNGLRVDVDSTDASDFIFQAGANGGSTEVLNVMANGNIGIGTSSPADKLQVAGKTIVGTHNSNAHGLFIESTHSTNKYGGITAGYADNNQQVGLKFTVRDTDGAANNVINLDHDAVDFFKANYKISGSSTSTGSFGSVVAAGSTKLGTASGNTHVLSGSVTIKSPSGDALILDDNNNGANKLSWAYNGTSQYYMRRLHTDGEFYISSNGSGGAVNITGDSNYGNMPVHIGYRLGIGNTSPTVPLQVTGHISGSGTGYFGNIILGGTEQIAVNNGNLYYTGGNLGIGTTAPDGELHVHAASAGTVTAPDEGNNFIIEDSATPGMSLLMPNNNKGSIYWGSPADNDRMSIIGDIGNNIFDFATRGTTGDIIRFRPNTVLNLTLQGVAGSEMAIFAGDVSGSATSTGSFGVLSLNNGGELVSAGYTLNVNGHMTGSSLSVGSGVTLRDGALSIYNGGAQVIQLRHDNAGELVFRNGNNAKNQLVLTDTAISGSAISTGSFGKVAVSDNITVGRHTGPAFAADSTVFPLHVVQTNTTDTAAILIQNSDAGDAGVLFNISGQSFVMGIDASATGDPFVIADSSDLSTTARMTIASDGVISGDFNDTSDVSLKENIFEMSSSYEQVKQLNPVTFNWKEEEGKGIDEQIGFIAQEVEKIYPQLVEGEEGNKSVNVIGLVSVLTKTVQELTAKVEELENKLK